MWTTFLVAGSLVAVPVLIHLFNRTRYRRINWAAMEFLLAAYKRTRRRVQFEHLLLLILRVLAMACIAFAFFPQGVSEAGSWFLKSTGITFTSDAEAGLSRHLMLVIDDTASMTLEDRGGASCFKSAIERSQKLIGALKPGRDFVTIIRASDVAAAGDRAEPETGAATAGGKAAARQEAITRLSERIRAMSDLKKASETLAIAKPSLGTASLMDALREAGRRVETLDADRESAEVAVVSDFQKNAWLFAANDDPRNNEFNTFMRALRDKLSSHNATIQLHDVGLSDGQNFSVLDVALEDPVVGVGIDTKIRVTVGNYASKRSPSAVTTPVRLQYRLDQGDLRPFAESVSLGAGGTVTVSQSIGRFDASGNHSVMVKLDTADRLNADDSRTLAVEVVDSLPVLIINGDPQREEQKDEAFFLRNALQLTQGEGDAGDRVTPIRVTTVPAASLDFSTMRLEHYAAVILANVGKPAPALIGRLEEYARRDGGAVIFTMGDQINAESANSALYKNGAGLLPARLTGFAGSDTAAAGGAVYAMEATNIGPGTPLEYIGEAASGKAWLESPQLVFRWMGTEVPKLADSATAEARKSQPRVLLSVHVDGAPPLLIEKQFGRGRSVLWTSTADSAWHYFWSTDDGQMLAIFQELVRNISVGDRARRNLNVGEPFSRMLQEDEIRLAGYRIQPPGPPPSRLSDLPNPRVSELQDGRRQLAFDGTSVTGLYRLLFMSNDNGGDQSDREELFAVGAPGVESDILRFGAAPDGTVDTKAAIEKGLPGIAVSFISGEQEQVLAERARSNERMDLWIFFIGLAGVFLLAEMGAAVAFGRRKE